MKDGNYHHGIRTSYEQNEIRKAIDQEPANIFIHFLKCPGMLLHRKHCGVKTEVEILSESFALFFIPVMGFQNISFSFGFDY